MEAVGRHNGHWAQQSALFCAPRPTVLSGLLHYYCLFCLGIILAFSALALAPFVKSYDFESLYSLDFEWKTFSSTMSMTSYFFSFVAIFGLGFVLLGELGLLVAFIIVVMMSAVDLPIPQNLEERHIYYTMLLGFAGLVLLEIFMPLLQLIASVQAQHFFFSLTCIVLPASFTLLSTAEISDLITNGRISEKDKMALAIAMFLGVLMASILTQLDRVVVTTEVDPKSILGYKIWFILIASMILFVASAQGNEKVKILIGCASVGVLLSTSAPAVLNFVNLHSKMFLIGLSMIAGGTALALVGWILMDAAGRLSTEIELESIAKGMAVYFNMTTAAIGAVAFIAIVLLVSNTEN